MSTRSKPRRPAVRVRGPRHRRRQRGRSRPGTVTALLALLAVGTIAAAALSVGTDAQGVQVSERTVTVERGVIETAVSGTGKLTTPQGEMTGQTDPAHVQVVTRPGRERPVSRR